MMTFAEYVEQRIKQLFVDIGAELAEELDEDEAAGLPMEIMMAQSAMLAAWREYVDKQTRRN